MKIIINCIGKLVLIVCMVLMFWVVASYFNVVENNISQNEYHQLNAFVLFAEAAEGYNSQSN